MMEPVESRVQGLHFRTKLSEKEISKMRLTIRDTFDKVQAVLRQVSSYMLLVLR